jgi:Ca-activated chloride channel family protein
MKFARIEMLFLIWVLPALLLAYLYGWRKRRSILNAFAAARTLAGIIPAGMAARRRWGAVLVLLASLLVVAAMAGPQYGFQWQKIERRGVDIIIALDCSRSMLATDIQPNRLDRAKREIYDLLNMLEGDRVGLAAFSGSAFLQCPLTIDYQAFYLFLEVLTPDYLPVGGTDLSAALRTAQEAFDPQATSQKAIILITDGENTGPDDPFTVAQEIQKAGIKLFCIGVGSGDGVPIPAGEGGFKKDASGRIILSRLDEALLTRMALATGGSYVRSVAGDMDLDTIYRDQIRAHMDATTVEGGRKQVWADRYQWPLALAVLLLFIVRWIPLIKKPLALALLPLAVLAIQTPAQAGPLQEGYKAYQEGDYKQALKKFTDGQLKDPDNPEILYNIGNAYYKSGDYAAAKEHYSQALPKAPPELKPKLLYNLGNSAFRQKQLQEAVKNYEAALKLTPQDKQAEENLAFAKQQMQQEKQKNQQQQQNQSDESQQSKADQQQTQQAPKDQKNQQDQGAGHNGQQKKPDQPPPPQDGSEMDQQKQQDRATQPEQQARQNPTASAAGQQDQKRSDEQPAGAQMLNRLKDQPGRAMMPNYRKRQVDKDW